MREGRDDEVLLCGHCLQGCFVNVKAGQGIGCNINPLAGHELEEVLPADRPRHVAVVGGGPAGIQAALTARRRGHRVTLFESDRLGGQFALAHLSPGKGRIRKSLDSLVSMLEHSDVEVRIGEEATREKLERLGIEAVVLATGSRPVVPDIPGLEDPVAGEDVLTGERKLEGRVLVLGGGMVAVEVAETLAKAGAEVVAVRRSSRPMADDMDPLSRKMTMMRLSSLPVELHNETRVAAFENGEAFVEEQGGRRSLGVFDHVVAAAGNESHDTLSDSLRAAGIEVILAGDAERPGKVIEAVCSGHQAGMHA